MLEVGTKAPDFTLKDQNGQEIRLSSFLGKKVVLYFYPRDNTPGCTREACAYADKFETFKNNDTIVIGISKDSIDSHFKFVQKFNLPFILLSDEEKKVLELYGVWQEKKMYGKVSMGVVRSTYVIDESGIIVKVYKKAKPDTNAQEVLEFLNAK